MAKYPPYRQIITQNLLEDPNWGPYAKGKTGIPKQPIFSGDIADWFFYLGDLKRAREVSYTYSLYSAEEATKRDEYDELYYLFLAALYRSLTQKSSEAQNLWRALVNKRRKLDENGILQRRKAHIWIYEAYALTKLERFGEAAEPARRGFEGISKGKGIQPAPHKNSREYGLADVLIALADYRLTPTSVGKKKAQKALVTYKKENFKYGKLGYGVIFDLQFSYPDVFTPVLPGPDPEKD
jgi:hypothetical protein